MSNSTVDPMELEIANKVLALTNLLDVTNILATITQSEFQTLCDNNLMTDAEVDSTNLSTSLKTNIKFNNSFTRRGGKAIIACRDLIKYLAKRL